ncbi:MAG: hypothetical protein OXT69_13550 [Candidatus Poribacteria bacterium]|nr:hypothetical protein [Candidatus Poribacteria bacterium]
MKKAGRWRSLALISLALAGLAAGFLWLRYNNAGEPIAPKMDLPGYGAGRVISIEFFPDGKTLLSAYEDNSVYLWDVDSGYLLQTKSFPRIVRGGASVSNDGRTIAVNGFAELRLWNVSTGDIHISKVVERALVSIYFSPDSRTIASVVRTEPGSSSRIEYSIYIWDVETGALIHTLDTPNQRWERRVLYSPDSKKIVSAGGNTAKVWDVKTGALLHTFHGIERYNTIALSPDRSHTAGVLAAVCDGPSTKAWDPNTIKVWDLETGALLHTHGSPWSFKYSPDGKKIASVNYNVFNIRDTAANIWDMKTGALLHTSEVASLSHPYILDYFPDGKSILINPSGGSGEVWDVETGARLQRFRGGSLSRSYSRAGKS